MTTLFLYLWYRYIEIHKVINMVMILKNEYDLALMIELSLNTNII